MRDTSNFRTKTNFISRDNGHIEGIWEIAIDLGYSAVKLFSPNSVARFPSYAKRIDNEFSFAGATPKNSIRYKNLTTGEMWLVGEMAQNIMTSGDTTDSEASLYGRERYTNPMFKVIAETGLGLGMMTNEFGSLGNDRIVIQTGLPERYKDDADDLKDFLAGEHYFAIQIADGPWQTFHFNVSHNDVHVMSQPKGTLFSICIDKNGKFHADASKYLSSSIIIFDVGFGTLDIFPIVSGTVRRGETYSDLGMKRILQETEQGIKTELKKEGIKIDISVPSMQKHLETGKVPYMDIKQFKSGEFSFGDILAESSIRICEEAIARTAGALNLLDYNYLIVTGGTGAAWYNQIVEKFKNFNTLTIIKGSQNDDLPFVYANVRGYYFYRFNKLAQGV